MTAQQIHSAPSEAPADENVPGDSPAQSSSGTGHVPPLTVAELRQLNSLVAAFYRVCDLCAQHGWPKDGPVYPWLEQALAELNRHRVADIERDARERENAVTAQQHPVHRG